MFIKKIKEKNSINKSFTTLILVQFVGWQWWSLCGGVYGGVVQKKSIIKSSVFMSY